MDDLLLLRAEMRWCPDCAADTLYVPVPAPEDGPGGIEGGWCCTACDAAVVVLDPLVDPLLAASRAA